MFGANVNSREGELGDARNFAFGNGECGWGSAHLDGVKGERYSLGERIRNAYLLYSGGEDLARG